MSPTSKATEIIKLQLVNAFSPSFILVKDESDKHIGHIGAASGGGHFVVEISADVFNNKNLIDSHRLIYQALDNLMKKEIHALKIKIIK